MAIFNVKQLVRQTAALSYKNLLITVVRKPVSFVFFNYVLPITILALLLSVSSLVSPAKGVGVGSPALIRDFAIPDGKKLVIVKKPSLGPDVDRVITTFTNNIDPNLIHRLDNETDLLNLCLADLGGVSQCHAAVTFWDSPQTTGPVDFTATKNGSHTWQYTIRGDPSKNDARFDVNKHDSDSETFRLPLQLAVNNAITNGAVRPQFMPYTWDTEEEAAKSNHKGFIRAMGSTYGFALFACFWMMIYRLTSQITSERESGMSQLIDSMGGGSASTARVLSWLVTTNLACLPVFIAFGVVYRTTLFKSSDLSTLVSWQVLSGFAINSSTVFASSFFTKSRVSAIYVVGVFLLMSIVAQSLGSRTLPPTSTMEVLPLALIFSSSNFLFFLQQLCLWELGDKKPDIARLPEPELGLNSTSYNISQSMMMAMLGAQIFLFALLAILVEKYKHGIDFRNRSFSPEGKSFSNVVAVTSDLRKTFAPTFLEKIFCCGKRRPVTAVDGVNLQSHKGQILCLVGPNGSGKTTTLHMIAGFISPSAGSVQLEASPSQVGICPQRNTFWDNLTVSEHVSIWRSVKSGKETRTDLNRLIDDCDLSKKRKSYAKTLSGGQKRKLQLACMFVGDSTICLIDECTSGLDPLSRRAIWDILLDQRSKRSILLTTHFLDEVDVLADHIVILSKGKVRCAGTPTQLKNTYGGGYRVQVPHTAPRLNVPFAATLHQETLVFSTPDSQSAARLLSSFSAVGVTNVSMAGPQTEDVFLKVADEPELDETRNVTGVPYATGFEMSPGTMVSFWAQVRALFLKRLTVSKRFWWPYFYVLALPLFIVPFFQSLLFEYKVPSCGFLDPELQRPELSGFNYGSQCASGRCDRIAVAPLSVQDEIVKMAERGFFELSAVEPALSREFATNLDTREKFLDHWNQKVQRTNSTGGIFGGDGTNLPIISERLDSFRSSQEPSLLDLWSQMTSGTEIISSKAFFAQIRKDTNNVGLGYVLFFALLHAIYPAAFSLYPAIEKARKVRSLEYANGVRRGPLWVAYSLFDFMFIFVIGVGVTMIMAGQLPFFSGIWIMAPVLILYGLAAMLMGYVISHFVVGPLKAFASTAGVGLMMFSVASIAYGIASAEANSIPGDPSLGTTNALNIFMPVGNVFRASALALNVDQVACKDGLPAPLLSMNAFGGPILYLVIQIALLLLAIIWIEGDLALFRRKKVAALRDSEKWARSVADDIETETARVEHSESDFLRCLHVSKSFGSNKAVDDVTLGLPEGEVLALLGPNGAGKSTLVNLIQSELAADEGQILLRGEDSRTRSAQKHIGVCPQHDAIDLMNTREHLTFFARIKGIKDIKGNVDHLMTSLDLTPHASTLASKLSGGNKRKLSLAIALMGTPPVLVLDEPTSAMDAVAKRSFWKVIDRISHNRSVLLTTHSMEEADALATRAAIFSKSILALGTTRALRDKYSNAYYATLVLKTAPNSSSEEMEHVHTWLHEVLPCSQLERGMLGGQIRFTIPGVGADGIRPVARFIELLEMHKDALGIETYSVSGPTLERVFLNVVKENHVQEEDGRVGRGQWLRDLLGRRG